MNVNEVIGNLANEHLTGHKGQDEVHPNTHVNMGQSTNDIVTSAEHLCIYPALDKLAPELDKLADAFAKKAIEFADVIKVGRTCLQDAVPLTHLGQEFGGYADLPPSGRKHPQFKSECFYCWSVLRGRNGLGCAPGIRKLSL